MQIQLLHNVITGKPKEKDSDTSIDLPVAQIKLISYKFGKLGVQKQA